jgi:hypothetical protein
MLIVKLNLFQFLMITDFEQIENLNKSLKLSVQYDIDFFRQPNCL